MQFDIFLSICQTEVDGFMPSETQMWKSFFEQAVLADELGFNTAWVAETHLSCEIQKQNPGAVIPHFKGEIGLNTDILQMAHKVFAKTKRINVGSAIRNIFCNGGPIAHAEAVKMFLSLHGLDASESRLLEIGFASGRFPFSNVPYGIVPRNPWEKLAWEPLKGLILNEATEIFLRFLRGDVFSSDEVSPRYLTRDRFRSDDEWNSCLKAYQDATGSSVVEKIPVAPYWVFPKVGVIPKEPRLDLLRLTIGTHDPQTQILANKFMPCGVFNLSITPPHIVEETHVRMQKHFHSDGGEWRREFMPRTAMIFIDEDSNQAKKQAEGAWENYWLAMEGTLDTKKVESAVSNAIVGNPAEVAAKLKEKYHPRDRLMLWFDFNNHNSQSVMRSMQMFTEKVKPQL